MLVNRPLTSGRRSASKRGGMPGNSVANDPAANEHLETHCLQAVSNIARATVNARGARCGFNQVAFERTAMSALPPKADMCGATRDVRFGPIADMNSALAYVR